MSDSTDPHSAAGSATAPAWSVRTVPLGGGALAHALQQDARLHDWLAPLPATRAAWAARVASVRAQAAGHDWYTPLAPAFAASGAAAQRLARAAREGVVVTTGQQPGLFGGPMYTFSKAMSALAMADVLEAATGCPVAPVFWAATDDADWMEAAVAHVATSTGLTRIALAGPATEGVAMAEVPLGPMDAAHAQLRAACGSAAHAQLLDMVCAAYEPEATIGDAYVRMLRALLEPLGIAVLDASHASVKAVTHPLLVDALEHAAAIEEAVGMRTARIRDAGFTPQVELVDGLSLVFASASVQPGAARVRTRVPVAEAGSVAARAEVGSLGANVLLRPVIERAILPTVAYHAGPGELSYFAQLSPIAEVLRRDVPLAVPRWSGELRDARAEQLAASLGLDDDMLRDPHAAETRVAREHVDADVQDALERLQVAIEAQVRALRGAVARSDSALPPTVVDGLATSLTERLSRFDRRLTASVKRHEVQLMRDVAAVRAALRPDGVSPERKLNLVPMLARFGPAVLDAMRAAARIYVDRLVEGR
ncbi:MAG: bacillithiol biosynthesis BshC [Gemmatimonadaceae bacterium]|nr:bacillithiol biosynthesis BshC [Gemmatimonadaceae bacterium]